MAKYIGGIFETAFADPEIGAKLTATGAATTTMSMSAATGNAYWQGKVNLPMAMAKRTVKVEGNIASLLKLAPLGKKLYPGYIQRLKDDGRDDLLNTQTVTSSSRCPSGYRCGPSTK